jgi:hypothetical protein
MPLDVATAIVMAVQRRIARRRFEKRTHEEIRQWRVEARIAGFVDE